MNIISLVCNTIFLESMHMVNCIVIDDNQDIVDLFCELLDVIDVDVLATGNDGNDAIVLYKKFKPDVVLIDLQMPKYDGIFAIENIKDDYPAAKFIVVTGDLNAYVMPIFDILHIPVIRKPFDVHFLKQAISDVLLVGDDTSVPFEIRYKFKDDINYYSCMVTFSQYRNLKKLPVIQECEILHVNKKNLKPSLDEMQKALDLAFQNDTSHIRNLSEIIGPV